MTNQDIPETERNSPGTQQDSSGTEQNSPGTRQDSPGTEETAQKQASNQTPLKKSRAYNTMPDSSRDPW